MNDQEIIDEFLIESNENLARLDQEMVQLEQHPDDVSLLADIFRTMHTIKGTCGFLGFSKLESVTHLAENILSQLRDGKRSLTPALVSLILEAVDATKTMLTAIEATGADGVDQHEELRKRLQCAAETSEPVKAPVSPAPQAAAPGPQLPALVPDPIAPAPAAPAPAVEPPPETEAMSGQKGPSVADSTIRVPVGLLDKLMNLVGELVLTRNQILQFTAQQNDSTLNATSQRLNLITTELQGGVMKTRMQPIGVVWNKLPRVVRDLSASFGKQIELVMDGADTELDRTIMEAIKDPITHIVRNCCDHGIENPDVRVQKGKPAQGTLSLRAYHEGGQVNIEISDDGAGIDIERVKRKALQQGLIRQEQAERLSDREALNLIFLPGFSTAKEVTNISGRGVGMDVVRTNIEKIGGIVDLSSRLGQGVTLKLKIPLTLAIIPGLVVTNGNERFVIPQVSLLELIRLEGQSGKRQIESIHGTPVYRRRGKLLPITYLSSVLGQTELRESDIVNIVVLQAEDRQFGLVVDGISDTQEIVVKPLGKQLKNLSCYAGATIMGDGQVALILDVLGIGQLSGVLQESREAARTEAAQKDQAGNERQTFLLFRAGAYERLSVPLSLVARLEEIPQAKIEFAGGRRVTQYRGQILPLVSLGLILDSLSTDTAGSQDPAQVVVFANGDRTIGIVVDQILDIVEDTVSVRRQADRKGLLGSAVIGKKVTDLLDLHAVIESADNTWFGRRAAPHSRATVMIAEGSSFSRGLMRNCLEMGGYQVVEACDADEAMRTMESRKVDAVLAALDLPVEGAVSLVQKMRSNPDFADIPTLALANSVEEKQARDADPHGFEDCQIKFDWQATLLSLSNLAAAVQHGNEVPVVAGKED